MTVHKSQGSQFDTAAVLLPGADARTILTRELLYTAVTRARERADPRRHRGGDPRRGRAAGRARVGARGAGCGAQIRSATMADRLYFTDDDDANALIAQDPMALLVGFVLDQQVTVQKAFAGPLAIKERLGSIDADTLANADLEPVFRERPAIHRFPGSMAQRVHALAVHVQTAYDGDAARVWTDARDAATLRANLAALPGFGAMKIKALGAVLAKRFDVEAANELVPWHPTLGDVDSPQALADYQAAKRIHKAEWSKARADAR